MQNLKTVSFTNKPCIMRQDQICVLDIVHQTMADGPGFRTAIYCAGCRHYCKGCHNPQSWDINNGHWMSVDELLPINLDDEMRNVTFYRGDPLYQVEAFTLLARLIKQHSRKTIWCWTGFTYEEILADERMSRILPYIDVLVDGPFILEQRDTSLLFRGSPNQRIIYHHGEPPEDDIPGTVKIEKPR